MQKKDILLGAGLTSVLVGAGVVNTVVQANELTQPTESTVVSKTATSQDLSKAQEVAKSAQATVDQKVEDVKAAEGQQTIAANAVANIKEDIKTAQNAATIVEEQNKVIDDKTEQKSELSTELSNAKTTEQTAKDNLTSAQQAHDNAVSAVKNAEKTVEDKKTALDQATATVSQDPKEIQKELDGVTNQVTAKSAQIAATSSRIDAKQQEVDNYKPVIKTTDLNPSERTAVAHDNLMNYEHNRNNAPKDASGNPTMEPVNFQGVKIVEIEATQDMLDFQKALEDYRKAPYDFATRTYKERPVFRYKVDNRGLSQAFVKLLNELREANGVAGNMQVDDAYLDYAQQRANEMQRNNVLSHNTSLTAPGNKNEIGLENGGSGYGDIVSNEDGYINFNRIVTHETLAYDMLLRWYDDYRNVMHNTHGHRRALLLPMGGKMGLALANIVGSNDVSRYVAFENNAHTGSTYSTDEDGTTYLEEESDSTKAYVNNYNNFKDDALNPTFYGRKMKFIADHHFVFVTRKQEGDNSALVRDLNELKSLKARQEGERDALVARQTALAGKLSAATRSQEQRTTAIANATTELNNATAALAVAKLSANATAATLEEKNLAAERATNYVNHLTERVAAVQGEINKATEARDKATRLQGQLGNLATKLAQAEQNKANADQRVADAKLALKQAQKALSDAESDVQHLTDILAIDKALAVYQDNQGVVSAVTHQTPTVEVLPTFDLNAELNGYKVTTNANGIGATTTTAPIAEELPTFDLDGELNSYKVTRNADGIVSTPITTPTVDEVPTFDLNGYKTSPKHAGARPNDTPSQTLPMFSRKDATKQELPNTGSYSRVERQIALGGYTILGLILGFTIQRKRER
ncbi:CAP domain-containing protein [uncultured Streptococcus sp.]|uniref:CAP domain-containing protein n=1 Tax=uncultured Streptococcus sp. TaxID=83427 RepID=UPI0025D197B2|nr:CAP domain-containing protein [uncultured Streptococcus sp.]